MQVGIVEANDIGTERRECPEAERFIFIAAAGFGENAGGRRRRRVGSGAQPIARHVHSDGSLAIGDGCPGAEGFVIIAATAHAAVAATGRRRA